MACSLTPTRQTTRGRADGIRAAPSCRPRWRAESGLASSGMHLLRAVALGYDIGARTLIALRPGLPNSHKSTHSIAGVFGAAAAAGCAASLAAPQMRWMLDYTAQQCSGIASWFRDRDHIEKGFVFGGMPARNGVTAALLVHAGWTGVDDVLSGRDNFLLANAPQADAGAAGRETRRTLRSRRDDHQAMDGGNAHPGAARCDGGAAEAAADRSGSGAANPRALGAGVGRGQQRSSGHQHSVRHGADADRQDGHLPIDPRQSRGCRIRRFSVCGPRCVSKRPPATVEAEPVGDRRSSRSPSPTARASARMPDRCSAPCRIR